MKVHYEIVFSEPDESDPEGWSEVACRMYTVENLTKYEDQVTCKNCLKIIQKRFINSLVEVGNGVGGVKMTADKTENQKLILELLERSKVK